MVMCAPPFGGLNGAKKGSSKHKGALKNGYVAAEFKTKATGVGLHYETRGIKIRRSHQVTKWF